MNRQAYNRLIFDLSHPGRRGVSIARNPYADASAAIPEVCRRSEPLDLPEVDELTVARHYTNMSTGNYGVDTGFYPLGSCTMKYNPKISEEMAANPVIGALHPMQPVATTQGALRLYWELQRALSEIAGLSEFTLNPFAGAHGELTGLMVIHAWHERRGDAARTRVLVPDSAHGTNPASAAMAGFDVVEVKSLPDGTVDVDDLASKLDDTVAAMMMTNPNTAGVFERQIPRIAAMVHEAGALMYYDGANLNPMLGIARPGDMGFDVMHINLHKTFSTPHGGGGPGAGPVGVRADMEHLLPNPRVVRRDDGTFSVECTDEACGRVSGWLGNYAVLVRAITYIKRLGAEGLMHVGPLATLNANYVMNSLNDLYLQAIPGHCKHEFVFDGLIDKSTGVTTLNVAKRLLDYGFHAPTIYFPLLFHESMMIEPTESESIETLDAFIEAMRKIAHEAADDPELVKGAPHCTPVAHPDEAEAAIHPLLTADDICNDTAQ